MADSVDGAPSDSWEVADVDAAVSRLILSSKQRSVHNSYRLNAVSIGSSNHLLTIRSDLHFV
ncbi:hypothetical protein Hdeb2414_s0013g00403861 [Helianthus debilis subsp. tardiflorus]